MNKIKSIICLMVVVCTMCFAGCGGNNPVGNWVVESIDMGNGEQVKFDDVKAILGVEDAEDFVNFNVKSDKTLEATSMGTTVSGTWEEKDGKVILTVDGVAQELKFENGKLVFEVNGQKAILKKK